MHLHLDLESRSAVDLRKTGVYVYAADPSTDLWCAAYAADDGPVGLWRPGEPCPDAIRRAVEGGHIIYAHNANFERIMWKHILAPRYGWPEPALEQWRCTMAMSLAMSFPASLERAAYATGLDITKDAKGAEVMKRMARPRRINADGTNVWWDQDADKRAVLEAYCVQDVEVERALHKRLCPLSQVEQKLWVLDQQINDRGVYIDRELCGQAKRIVTAMQSRLNASMTETTGGLVEKCSDVLALAAFLEKHGVEHEDLRKDTVAELLKRRDLPDAVRDTLELRQDAAKASVKKIDSALAGSSADGRARGLFFYHGATTGRWSGRRVQPQNLQRPDPDVSVDEIIKDVLTGDFSLVEMLHGNPLAAVGNAIRGIVAAAPGHDLLCADFANIEGRVLAWLAGEEWKLQAFRDYDAGVGPDLYKLAYARSFDMSPDEVTKLQRQIGKVQELALGYQGGVGAFQSMARLYGVTLSDDVAENLKRAWRAAHPNVVAFWRKLEDMAFKALDNPKTTYSCGAGGRLKFHKEGSFLWVQLPSGRVLCYPYPHEAEKEMPWKDEDGKPVRKLVFAYRTEVARSWVDTYAYGGHWAENIVQATARDLLAEAITRLEAAGYPIVAHAHDEAVAEVPQGYGTLEDYCRTMSEHPAWAEGLPITAEGWRGPRYRK